jgi:hypothetical protein
MPSFAMICALGSQYEAVLKSTESRLHKFVLQCVEKSWDSYCPLTFTRRPGQGVSSAYQLINRFLI